MEKMCAISHNVMQILTANFKKSGKFLFIFETIDANSLKM